MDVFDQNTVVPVVVIVVCVVVSLITQLLTRQKPTSITVPEGGGRRRSGGGQGDPGPISPARTDPRRAVPPAYRPPAHSNGAQAAAPAPGTQIAGVAPAESTGMALETWHRHYGASVHAWIRNHEALLDEITDGGLEIQSVSRELTQRHEQLAPIIRDAIEAHPAADMRTQLSAMIVSSQATLHSLHRRQYDSAEHQHLTYLDYRDSWLDRLRKFETSDANSRELWDLADQQRQTPGWT